MKPNLEQLESRLCPSPLPAGAAIAYGGGRELTSPQVVMIHTDPSLTSYMDQAEEVVLSQVLQLTAGPYNVHPGALIASVNVPGVGGTALITTQINDYIAGLIASGQVPPPGPNTLYIYGLAPGQYVTDEGGLSSGGYHDYFTWNGQQIVMAGIYSATATLPATELATFLPMGLEHETIEAGTDAQYPTGFTGRLNGTPLGGNFEVMDIWANVPQYYFEIGGFTFQAIAAPDGSPILGPVSPLAPPSPPPPISVIQQEPQQAAINVFADLVAVAAEEFTTLEYRVLALIDPRDFAGPSVAAQDELAANPLLATPEGQYAAALGRALFLDVLTKAA